jgi:DcuC family C4-dicarboxylate transporter
MTALVSLLVIVATVYAILRRVEVRLVLLLGGFALGLLAGDPLIILRTFLTYLTSEQFILPLGCCMGFAHVLRHTGCDQHLVHLLARPLERVRSLLVPGVVLVAVFVNVPIVSQTSTAAVVGSVLVPVMRSAHITPATIGATLILGSSIGGELLNPSAVEFRTVTVAINEHAEKTGGERVDGSKCARRAGPLLLVHLAVALPLFWFLCYRHERHGAAAPTDATAPPTFAINYFKALVPLVPVTLLFLTALPPPLRAFTIDPTFLVAKGAAGSFESRLIGAAMLIGVVVAALTTPSKSAGTATAFFDGVGYAITHIISVIVAANCFGEGVQLSGLGTYLAGAIESAPQLLLPSAGAIPMSFAWVCGSGMATTQTLFRFFLGPALSVEADPVQVGAVVSLGAAAGRTMSPVAAVVIMTATMCGTTPLAIVRRTAVPMIAGMIAVVIAAMVLH